MLYEYVDRELLKQYIDNWESLPWNRGNIDLKEAKKMAIDLYTATNYDNCHPIKMIPNTAPFRTRSYVDGPSLQRLIREIRCAICKDYYNDYDIVNCHPTILLHFAKEKGHPHDLLEDYCHNRTDWIHEGMILFKCDYEDIKQQVTYAIDGGTMPYITKRYAGLWEEIKVMQNELWNDNAYDFVRKYVEQSNKENQIGSFMSYMLQFLEATIMEEAINYLVLHNVCIDSLVMMFDGFMLDSKQSIDLEALNRYVVETTGIHIQIIQKPMISFNLPPKPHKTYNIFYFLLLMLSCLMGCFILILIHLPLHV